MQPHQGTTLKPVSAVGAEPYAESLLKATVESRDPLQGDRVVGEVDLTK